MKPTPTNPRSLLLSTRAYAVNIKWDTDGEDIEYLPERVSIPFFMDDDEIADYLSDKYGFCVFGFDIEQI